MTHLSRIGAAAALGLLLCAPLLAAGAAPLVGGCVLKGMVGVACPGCGLGHALLALRAGEGLAALQYYPPLLPLSLLYVLALWALLSRIGGKRSPGSLVRSAQWVGSGTAASVIINWAIVVAAR